MNHIPDWIADGPLAVGVGVGARRGVVLELAAALELGVEGRADAAHVVRANDGRRVYGAEVGQAELRPALADQVDGDELLLEEDDERLRVVVGDERVRGRLVHLGLVDGEKVDDLGGEVEADVGRVALDDADRDLVRVVDARTAAAEYHERLLVAARLHHALAHRLARIRSVDDVGRRRNGRRHSAAARCCWLLLL